MAIPPAPRRLSFNSATEPSRAILTLPHGIPSRNCSATPRTLRLESFRVRLLDSNLIEEIPAQEVKAVFYVNSFDGDSDHQILNFHSRAPIIHGIWMRLQFVDGEVMEGIVYNSIRYLIDPGFFLLPTDPDSNNKVVYVRKSRLVDLRVLGMRKL